MGAEPCAALKPYKSITSIPSLISRPIILLATATITEENLFANGLFGAREEGQEGGEYIAVYNDLRLHVVTSDNVAHGAEGGRLNGVRGMHEELHKTLADA
jgi:hypothetical protein